MKRLLASLALVVLLAACQQTLDADVTRFNTLSTSLAGQSFSVLPDKGQAGNLEFQHYSAFVANALQSYGLRPAASEAAADVAVFMHYGNAGRQIEYFYQPGTPWGWGGPGWWGPGWGWGGYYGGNVTSYTTYSFELGVEIVDGPAWRAGQSRMLFQGRALGESGIRDLNTAMPYLVQALFQNFPGANGQTARVSVPIGGT